MASVIAQNKANARAVVLPLAHRELSHNHHNSFLKIFQTFLVLFSDYNAPFAQWSTERVCNWLEDFGLGQYIIFARQWVTSGHTLLTATPQDMEKVTSCNCSCQTTRVEPVYTGPFKQLAVLPF